jgi:hypothetical protein
LSWLVPNWRTIAPIDFLEQIRYGIHADLGHIIAAVLRRNIDRTFTESRFHHAHSAAIYRFFQNDINCLSTLEKA